MCVLKTKNVLVFDLNQASATTWRGNPFFPEKTADNKILSDEAETWLKQDETEFTTMHRTLEANEGSNIDWRAFATYQLDHSQHCEPPLLSVDMFSPNVPLEN